MFDKCGQRCSEINLEPVSCLDTDHSNSDEEEFCIGNGKPIFGDNYVIDRILARRRVEHCDFFYIKWLGWPYSRCTWEPEKNILNGGQAMEDFLEKEKYLDILGVTQRSNDNFLPQLRNLDRWERRMNDASSYNDKKIFIFNGVDDACRPRRFKYTDRCIFRGHARSDLLPKKQCRCPLKYFCDGSPVFVSGLKSYKLAVVRTRNCGWGVFTLEKIPAGKFVFEFVGEILPVKEANKRGDYDYQFDLNCEGGTKYVIDAKYIGNESAFMNHSCEANLRAVILYDENAPPAYHRMALFSKVDIKEGKELTLDYYPQFSKDKRNGDSLESKRKGLKCHCGSRMCIQYFPEGQYSLEI